MRSRIHTRNGFEYHRADFDGQEAWFYRPVGAHLFIGGYGRKALFLEALDQTAEAFTRYINRLNELMDVERALNNVQESTKETLEEAERVLQYAIELRSIHERNPFDEGRWRARWLAST